MPSRRDAIHAAVLALTGFAGCTGDPGSPTPTNSSPESGSPSPSDSGAVQLAALSVADFVLYPLAGTHPHVHRRAGHQYVVVRIEGGADPDRTREQLSLELDGEPVALAERQPVPWANETVDVAFAVSKDRTTETGSLTFDGTTLRTLGSATVERLNTPPVFEVGTPSVSPSEIQAGEQVEATVEVGLSNVGDGPGTFGASLTGNYVSGSNTITQTLDAGATTSVSEVVTIAGEGEDARVRLDWGADEWVETVPVVGTETG